MLAQRGRVSGRRHSTGGWSVVSPASERGVMRRETEAGGEWNLPTGCAMVPIARRGVYGRLWRGSVVGKGAGAGAGVT